MTRRGPTPIGALLRPVSNVFNDETTGPLVIARAKGVFVYAEDGTPYLDGMAGVGCATLGYGNEEIAETAREQMLTLSFWHSIGDTTHPIAIELADKLAAMAPIPVAKVFFATSGSEANETQVKLAVLMRNLSGQSQKKKIVAHRNGYHGSSLVTASMTGLSPYHTGFDLPLGFCRYVAAPSRFHNGHPGESEEAYVARLARELEELIQREGPETVGMFIAEPACAGGGMIIPPPGYYAAIGEVLRRYDVTFIADDIVCAFGRLGEMFGSQAVGMTPDTISLAKGLSGANAPISAVLVPPQYAEALREAGRQGNSIFHGFTYSGHPLSAAIALKCLEIYERDDLVGQVRRKSARFSARLAGFEGHPIVGNVRSKGLFGAVELFANPASRIPFDPSVMIGNVCERFARQEGLLVRSLGQIIAFCPPLVITEDEIDDMFDRFGRTLERTLSHVRTKGLAA